MIKCLCYQIDTLTLIIHVPNSIVLIHIKEKLTELIGEIDEHTSIMGDFQKPLSVTLYKQTKI